MKAIVNGRLLDEKKPAITVRDQGLLRGDGVFETLPLYGGRPFLYEAHFRRLRESARRIGLRLPWSRSALARQIQRLRRANRISDAKLRITVTRGEGPLKLSPSECGPPTWILHLEKILPPPPAVHVILSRVRRTSRDSVDPAIKTTSFLNGILAKQEAASLGADDAILLNADGFVAEATTANVFWARRGRLFTPDLSVGILPGVTRALLLRLARRLRVPVRLGRYRPKEMLAADEAFLSSSVVGVLPIRRLPGRILSAPGPLTRRLQQAFQSEIQRFRDQA